MTFCNDMHIGDKARLLFPLLSIDRSRDMSHFINIGRILCNLLGDGPDILDIWKKITIQQRQYLCDEYWSIICKDVCQPMNTIKYILGSMADIGAVDLSDIESVKHCLQKISNEYIRVKSELERIDMESIEDIDDLLNQKVDCRAFSKCSYSIHILQHMAKLDNPMEYRKLLSMHMSDKSVEFGTYSWGSVRNAIKEGVELANDIEKVLVLLKASVAHITHGGGRFVLYERDGLVSLTENEFYSVCKHTKVACLCNDKKNVSLYDILDKYSSLFSYDSMEYYPGRLEGRILNLFKGYAGKIVDSISDDIQVILDHLKIIQCNNNQDMYEYLLNWLAFIVQKPIKPGTAILMVGKQGVGKTIFWEFFSRDIIGRSNCYICSTLEEVTSNFNGHLLNKRFLMISECKGASKHDHSKLKSIITDAMISIQCKHMQSRNTTSPYCVVITSNHRDHHFIDEDDRRFVMIECSSIKKDSDYFNRLASIMDEHGNSFYTFLMNRDISSFDPRQFPKSQLRLDTEEDNIDPVQAFIHDHPWQGWKLASHIFRDYERWTELRGVKPVHRNQFKRRAGNIIDSKHTNLGKMYMIKATDENDALKTGIC